MNLNRFCFLGISLCGVVTLWGCDLQPKIASIPDSIGDFISTRYPALLADPEKEPEIYNSAVTDYGVYASPELYGSGNIDDYVLYASVDDYVLKTNDEKPELKIVEAPPKKSEETHVAISVEPEVDDYLSVPKYVRPTPEKAVEKIDDADFVIVARGDTLYSIARGNNTTVSELAKINSLNAPYTLRVGQKLKLKPDANDAPVKPKETAQVKESPVQPVVKLIEPAKSVQAVKAEPNNTKRVAVQEIAVAPGDTLYSLSRKYEIPVNDLAVMNKISSPFTLSVGQKLKVPKLDTVETKSNSEIKQIKSGTPMTKAGPKKSSEKQDTVHKKIEQKSAQKKSEKKSQPGHVSEAKPKQNAQTNKISSDPQKQLPKIAARSANKFSWPVRGKILSQYGAKKGGLFNDGINISANLGTLVKAAENGVVAYAGNEVKGMGNLVIIQHSDGWMTVYAHLDSMSVRRGTKVSVGQQIGKIGKTGKVDKPQLHFEIRKGTKAYNPITYLKK